MRYMLSRPAVKLDTIRVEHMMVYRPKGRYIIVEQNIAEISDGSEVIFSEKLVSPEFCDYNDAEGWLQYMGLATNAYCW